MKLIGNSSYGYQIMDRSKNSKTQYVFRAEVDNLVNERSFKNLNVLLSSIYEVEMVKLEVNHKEPIIVGFYFLQHKKPTMLQLFDNFFHCSVILKSMSESKWIQTVFIWHWATIKLKNS